MDGALALQVVTLYQVMNDKPWADHVLQELEEALPLLKAEELRKTASSYKASTGVWSRLLSL